MARRAASIALAGALLTTGIWWCAIRPVGRLNEERRAQLQALTAAASDARARLEQARQENERLKERNDAACRYGGWAPGCMDNFCGCPGSPARP